MLQVGGRKAPRDCASKRFCRAEQTLWPIDRMVLGVLHALDQLKTYLQRPRRLTLVTDCAALLWFFDSPYLSRSIHRWAMENNSA